VRVDCLASRALANRFALARDSGQATMNADVLRDCLKRLLPHVDHARIALTGGVAIGVHIGNSCGEPSRAVAADDVDFVAESVDVIRPTVTSDFLVSHFHLPQPGHPKFLVQLVDPVARLRLDFFPDALQVLGRASVVEIGGIRIRMLGTDDILEHKLRLLATASAEVPTDPKHYRDAVRLAALSGRETMPMGESQLVSTANSHELDAACPRCQASRHAAYPLAEKQAIFDVLRYV
jgi:hypothetical protein